jgi:hypothetical protein
VQVRAGETTASAEVGRAIPIPKDPDFATQRAGRQKLVCFPVCAEGEPANTNKLTLNVSEDPVGQFTIALTAQVSERKELRL